LLGRTQSLDGTLFVEKILGTHLVRTGSGSDRAYVGGFFVRSDEILTAMSADDRRFWDALNLSTADCSEKILGTHPSLRSLRLCVRNRYVLRKAATAAANKILGRARLIVLIRPVLLEF
jgi:hypothetical protein